MPTYLYLCEIHGEFEEEHSIKITLEDCSKCKADGLIPQKLKPLISGGSGRGIVELYGNDLITKCKEDAQKLKKDMHKSANTYANMLGETRYNDLQTKMDRQKR